MDIAPNGPFPSDVVPDTQNGKVSATVSDGRSRLWMMVSLVVTYLFLLVAPTPVMPLRSMVSTTIGGVRKSGSSITFALISALPEKVTPSVEPLAGAPTLLDWVWAPPVLPPT